MLTIALSIMLLLTLAALGYTLWTLRSTNLGYTRQIAELEEDHDDLATELAKSEEFWNSQYNKVHDDLGNALEELYHVEHENADLTRRLDTAKRVVREQEATINSMVIGLELMNTEIQTYEDVQKMGDRLDILENRSEGIAKLIEIQGMEAAFISIDEGGEIPPDRT